MKISSKKYLARHEKFRWTNYNKFRKILLDQEEFGTNSTIDKHTKTSVGISKLAEIQKVKYRWTDISAGLISLQSVTLVPTFGYPYSFFVALYHRRNGCAEKLWWKPSMRSRKRCSDTISGVDQSKRLNRHYLSCIFLFDCQFLNGQQLKEFSG